MTTGGFGAALLSFATAALTIIVLMFGLSYAIGTSQEGIVARLKASAPTVKRWGAYILVAVGVWFIVLGVFANFFETIFPV